MKKFITAIVIISLCATAAFAADPAEGFWLSVDNRTGEIQSGWEIYESNGYLYGKLLSAIGCSSTDKAVKCRDSYANFPITGKVNQLPVFGPPWIFGLSRESPGNWTNGNVINIGDGNMYKCSIIHHPADGKKFQQEALEIRGQLLFFSGSQYWKRTTREEASALRKKY
jgi:uncharacterized protein (DUF2147 family)